MQSNYAFIMCSDVSSFINQNKWDYVTPFLRLWKKYDSENYLICQETDQEIIVDKHQELQEFLGVELVSEIANTCKTQGDRAKNTETVKLKIQDLDIPDTVKIKLQENAGSLINTSYGTNNEDPALTLYEKNKNKLLDKSQQFFKVPVYTTERFEWFLGGKVDGKLFDKIIEVKTRSYCFFKSIRDYENTQIQLYMYLHNVNFADLVEYYGRKIKITEIKRNDVQIKKILSNVKLFIDAFEQFLNEPIEIKKKFYSMNLDLKKEHLYNMYLSEMD